MQELRSWNKTRILVVLALIALAGTAILARRAESANNIPEGGVWQPTTGSIRLQDLCDSATTCVEWCVNGVESGTLCCIDSNLIFSQNYQDCESPFS